MNAARRPQSLLRLAESHLEFARDEARRGYAKRDETLIRDSAEKTWLAVNEAVDHVMARHGRAPPVGRDAHTIRREFLELADRDLAKQLAYFAEALHGDCFYQGKCPTEQGMRVAQDEAAEFMRRLRAK
jgi:hypothetical protein